MGLTNDSTYVQRDSIATRKQYINTLYGYFPAAAGCSYSRIKQKDKTLKEMEEECKELIKDAKSQAEIDSLFINDTKRLAETNSIINNGIKALETLYKAERDYTNLMQKINKEK